MSELNRLLYGEEPERLPLLRTLKEVKIAEVGPVVWPAYSDTTASVRSADEEPVVLYRSRLKEPEQRRLLAEMLLRADAADTPDEGIRPTTSRKTPPLRWPLSTPVRTTTRRDPPIRPESTSRNP